ncbi:MAG: aspartate kinase [Caldilineaceae bacterium]|nr:aspartate kinase [Caldilineaceae bacterium]MDE0339953.1 aspartate kinase [Caldilineaceae bacterium]
MIVMKFGGTSVGTTDSIGSTAKIVAAAVERQNQSAGVGGQPDQGSESPGVLVVVSAMGGVTNTLIDAAQAAAAGDETPYRDARSQLLVRHQVVAGQLIEDGVERAGLGRLFDNRLREFERLCRSITVLGELTQRGLDVVSGVGERLSAPLLAAVLRANGVKAQFVDAGELIITDDQYGNASPLMDSTPDRCRDRLLPMMQSGVVPVVTGFVGATEKGVPTTLGRGGSDYSAAILGAALDADEIQIWTDVDGVMTADPRIVETAQSMEELSYEEVAELAYYGAKVLHPKTVTPAVESKIPLRVLNTFNPSHPGTSIVEKTRQLHHGVKAITAVRELRLITVAGRGMIGVPGIAARTFDAVARQRANVLMISQGSSEQSICFVVPETEGDAVIEALKIEFARELAQHMIEEISNQPDIVIVAVIGAGMKGTPGIAARVFNALGEQDINVIAIAQGSSEANISLVVLQAEADEAIRAIHDTFELGNGAD